MATTSIWRVKGWLGKVVIYVENPDKTTNPKFYTEEDMTERDGRELSDVIRYAVNSEKTQQAENEDCTVVHRFVSGINCSPATARDEMLAVKSGSARRTGRWPTTGINPLLPASHARNGARDRNEARRPFVGRPLSGDCGDPP